MNHLENTMTTIPPATVVIGEPIVCPAGTWPSDYTATAVCLDYDPCTAGGTTLWSVTPCVGTAVVTGANAGASSTALPSTGATLDAAVIAAGLVVAGLSVRFAARRART